MKSVCQFIQISWENPKIRTLVMPTRLRNMNALQLLEDLPIEVQYLVVAHLAKDRISFQAFSLSCKRSTSSLKDASFWRLAMASQGRVLPAEDAGNLKSLICRLYNRVHAQDFCRSTFYLLGAKLCGKYNCGSQPMTVSLSSSECVPAYGPAHLPGELIPCSLNIHHYGSSQKH